MMFVVGLSSLTWPRQQLHPGSGNSFASALPTWPKTPDTLNITAQIRIFEEMPPLLEQRLKCPIVSICLPELQFEVIRRENVQCPREYSHLKQPLQSVHGDWEDDSGDKSTLQRTRIQFPVPTRVATTIHKDCLRASNTLVWPFLAPSPVHAWHTPGYAAKTLTHKKYKPNKKIFFKWLGTGYLT